MADATSLGQISIDFNMVDGTIKATTAAVDENGNSYEVVFNQPTIDAAPEASPEVAGEATAEVVEPTADSEASSPVNTVPEKPEVYDGRILTLDEQRDIAVKVCLLFISVIFGAFGMLYVYHQMQQKTRNAQKQTL